MATKYRYCCDVCGKVGNKYFSNNRRYVVHVESVKLVVPVSTTNFDDLCDSCFNKLMQELARSTTYKSTHLKRR